MVYQGYQMGFMLLLGKNKGWVNFLFSYFPTANCSSIFSLTFISLTNFVGSRAEGQRSLEPVLPEQNDAVPASLPVAVAGAADPAEALPGSETSAVSAGSKRKLGDE